MSFVHKLRSRLHPDHFRIARTASVVLFLTVVAKLAVAGKDIALAWKFGRSAIVDAFNLAYVLAIWLPMTVISVMTIVLVPELVKLKGEGAEKRKRFLAELNGAGIWLGGGMLLITLLGIGPLMALFSRGMESNAVDLAQIAIVGFLPLGPLLVMVAIMSVRLQAANDHRYVLAEGIPWAFLVVLLLLWSSPDIVLLLVGTLIGTALQVAWLSYLMHRSSDGTGGLSFGLRSEEWSKLLQFAVVMGAGQLVFSISTPIDQYFAGRQGSGEIATLGYANRLISLLMTLVAMVISRTTLPIFAEGIDADEAPRILRLARAWSGVLLLIGTLSAVVMWWHSGFIVSVIFERGAFVASDTRAVSVALDWGIWQMPLYLGGLVLVSCLASQRRYRLISVIAVVGLLVKLVVLRMYPEGRGLNGIMLSSVAMYGSSFLLCFLSTVRPLRRNH